MQVLYIKQMSSANINRLLAFGVPRTHTCVPCTYFFWACSNTHVGRTLLPNPRKEGKAELRSTCHVTLCKTHNAQINKAHCTIRR